MFARAANNAWGPREAYLKASNPGIGDRFGNALALSADGQTLVAAAHLEGGLARGIGGDETDDGGDDVGAAYIFRRAGASWTQQVYLKASNAGTFATFGARVALSADATVIAVGAPGEDGTSPGINGDETTGSQMFPGAVYLY